VGLRVVSIKLDEAVLEEIGTIKGGGHPEVRGDQEGGLEVTEGEGAPSAGQLITGRGRGHHTRS